MWTDGQTDLTKLIVAFRNFPRATKNGNETYGVLHFSTKRKSNVCDTILLDGLLVYK